MAEIASGIAVLISLAALWLANSAYRQVDTSFEEFTQHLAKQVRDAQSEFSQRTEQVQHELRRVESTLGSIEAKQSDIGEKIHTLTQRIGVVEHDLKSLTDSIPPQYRRTAAKRDDRSA